MKTADSAKKLIKEAKHMFAKGNLRLHKFVSNSREVMEMIPCSERANVIKDLGLSSDNLPIERALGIQWCVEMCRDCARRDEPLSEELRPRWERWRDDLPELVNVKIPRCFQPEKFWESEKARITSLLRCKYD